MRELYIRVGETDYVYTSEPLADPDGLVAGGLLDGDPSVQREATETGLSVGSVELQVTLPFLGAASRYDLDDPADARGWRAVLLEDGAEVLSGHIAPDDVEVDRPVDVATVSLVPGAEAQLWTSLDGLQASEPALADWFPPVLYQGQNGGPFEESVTTFARAIRVETMLRHLLGLAGAQDADAIALPSTAFTTYYSAAGGATLSVERERELYLSTLGTTFYDTEHVMPRTARQVVTGILALFGWRLSVRYAAYPSSALVVEVIGDRWSAPEPDTLDALDDRLAEGGVTEFAAPARESDVGLRHATPLRGTSPVVPPYAAPPCPPPALQVYGGNRWAFETPTSATDDVDAAPGIDALVEPGFALPCIVGEEVDALPADGHAGLYERVCAGSAAVSADAPKDAVYLLERAEVADGDRCLLLRRVMNPPLGGRVVSSAASPASLLDLREVSRMRTWGMTAAFYTHGLAWEVGRVDRGLAFGGEAWRVDRGDVRLDDDRTELALSRPRGVLPPPARPPMPGRVQKIATVRETVGGVHYATVSWMPPVAMAAEHLAYQVEYRATPSDSWSAPVMTYATRWSKTLAAASTPIQFRVCPLVAAADGTLVPSFAVEDIAE